MTDSWWVMMDDGYPCWKIVNFVISSVHRGEQRFTRINSGSSGLARVTKWYPQVTDWFTGVSSISCCNYVACSLANQITNESTITRLALDASLTSHYSSLYLFPLSEQLALAWSLWPVWQQRLNLLFIPINLHQPSLLTITTKNHWPVSTIIVHLHY